SFDPLAVSHLVRAFAELPLLCYSPSAAVAGWVVECSLGASLREVKAGRLGFGSRLGWCARAGPASEARCRCARTSLGSPRPRTGRARLACVSSRRAAPCPGYR